VTVLVGRFNLIPRVFSAGTAAPSFPSSHVSPVLTFDYRKMKALVQYLSTSLATTHNMLLFPHFSFYVNNFRSSKVYRIVLGGKVVSVLAILPKVRRFKPGRGQWIFKDDKYLQRPLLQRGSKAVSPM
jgi:hypothetical protein